MDNQENCRQNLNNKKEQATPQEMIAMEKERFYRETEGLDFNKEVPKFAGMTQDRLWEIHLMELRLQYDNFDVKINTKMEAFAEIERNNLTKRELIYVYMFALQEAQKAKDALNQLENLMVNMPFKM